MLGATKAGNIRALFTCRNRVSVCNFIQNLPTCERSIMCGQRVIKGNIQEMSLSASSCLTGQPTRFPSTGNGNSAEINAPSSAASRQTTLSECEQPVVYLDDSVTSFLIENGISLRAADSESFQAMAG